MNSLSSTTLTDPYDKLSKCIQFAVDTPLTDPFVLKNIMTVGQQYTFSLWIMAKTPSSITVAENRLETDSSWAKYSVTFTATSTNLTIHFNNGSVYWLYHPQLEIGNKATDWRPAPEDHSEELETRFSIEKDKIEAQFTEVTRSVTELGEVIESKRIKNITESANGISITDSDGVYSILLDNNEGVTIRKNGEIRSRLKDNEFYTGNIVVELNKRAQFGNFAFVPRSDGSLSFLKVGD